MGESVPAQEMVVEEVAVRAVAYVMKEAGDAEQFLHVIHGGHVRTDLFE